MSEERNKENVAIFGAVCLLAAPVCTVTAAAFFHGWGGAFAAAAVCFLAGLFVAVCFLAGLFVAVCNS